MDLFEGRYHVRKPQEAIYSTLLNLWKKQLKYLPSWSKKVQVTRKSPVAPNFTIQVHLIRQDSRVEPFHLLKKIDGHDKDVPGTLIAPGIPISSWSQD